MKSSLRFKVTACVGAVLVVIYAALLVAETRLVTMELSAKALSSSQMLSQTVERSLQNAMTKRRQDEVNAIISSVAELPDIHRIAITDGEGKVILECPTADSGGTDMRLQEMIRSATKTGHLVFQSEDGDILRTVSPIRNEKRCWSCHGNSQEYLGYLLVDQSTHADRMALARNRRTIIVIGITGLVITVTILLFMLSRFVYRPVDRIMATMTRIKDGDISARAETSDGDELSRMSESLNAMVTSLEQQSTEIVKSRERLLEARRLAAVGLLAAGMAHEINNPTATISMASEGLARYVPTESPGRNLLDLIGRATDRISQLVSDLLRFDPNQPMGCELIDINCLLKESLNSVSEGLAGPEHSISLDLSANTEGLIGDRDRLRLAIANVIANAFEAMPSGGTLTIQTSSTDKEVQITISDTGKGISAEDLPLVTDPFFTRKESGKGRGLGLAVAREMVTQHGGELDITSNPNEGAAVHIIIPKQNHG